MNLEVAAQFKAWALQRIGARNELLFPWMRRVDLERLAVWLAKHDTSQAWICDYEDLKRSCL